MVDGQILTSTLADVLVDQNKSRTGDVIGDFERLSDPLDHAGFTAAEIAAKSDQFTRLQTLPQFAPQLLCLDRRMRSDNLCHCIYFGSIMATGNTISSKDIPPC